MAAPGVNWAVVPVERPPRPEGIAAVAWPFPTTTLRREVGEREATK